MSRFTKILAIAALIPALSITATASYAATFTDVQQKEIQGIIGSYLQSNPQVIIAALQSYQQKQMQDAEQTIKTTQKDAAQYVQALFHTATDPVAGNPTAPITIVEFFDYQCSHCVDMAPVISQFIKNTPNVRFVFKEFPIRGPISDLASRAALAANMQGKYLEFHDELMKTKQPYTQEAVLAAAKTVGLNVAQLQKDMDSAGVKAQIQGTIKLAQDLKLLGTPAFFIGKTDATTTSNIDYVPGQMNMEQLQGLIKKVK
jgi:protein-disulfide isomerase